MPAATAPSGNRGNAAIPPRRAGTAAPREPPPDPRAVPCPPPGPFPAPEPGITGESPGRSRAASPGAPEPPPEGRDARLIAAAPATAPRSDWPVSVMGSAFSQWERRRAVTRCPGRAEPGGAWGCCGQPGPPSLHPPSLLPFLLPSLPPSLGNPGPICHHGSRRRCWSPPRVRAGRRRFVQRGNGVAPARAVHDRRHPNLWLRRHPNL